MDIKDFFAADIFTAVLSALALSVVAYFMARVRGIAKKQSAIDKGVQALLCYCITQTYYYYFPKGYIPIHSRKNLNYMHDKYKALDGNGAVDDIVEILRGLPTEKPKE
jgi:hypothetical protein